MISDQSILAQLEIPIDSKVASRLDDKRKWISIKSLEKSTNYNYQELANQEAKKRNLARVHLDLEYWAD